MEHIDIQYQTLSLHIYFLQNDNFLIIETDVLQDDINETIHEKRYNIAVQIKRNIISNNLIMRHMYDYVTKKKCIRLQIRFYYM